LTTANPLGFPADNQLFISATNILNTIGSQWVTTLAVTNYGPASATNVVVVDSLPTLSAVTLISSNSSIAGAAIELFGNTLTWKVGALPLHGGATLNLAFRGNQNGVYTNGATVSSASDPNPDDDSAGALITIAPPPPLSLVPNFYRTAGRAFTLSITNYAGSTVVIEAATNLAAAKWLPVDTNIAPFTFTNFDNTNFPLRFYRAVIPQ
jgi:uncharacterized repeat protein (TIGR01451 family)